MLRLRPIAIIIAISLALTASPAYAHAFGQRYDLPIPLSYFLMGAAAAVALSFLATSAFAQTTDRPLSYPRLNLLQAPILGALLSSQIAGAIVKTLSLAIFALIIIAGFAGTSNPIENISPTFVWIIWWVGMGYVAALLGNAWALINPWKIAFDWQRKLRGLAHAPENPPFRYPESLGAWPATAALFIFAWMENVYVGAFQPFTLSVIIIAYSTFTWVGMTAFGKHEWLRRAEVFSVLFALFARFSPTEIRVSKLQACPSRSAEPPDDCVDCHECFERAPAGSRQINLRPFAVGLARPRRVSMPMTVFVILALAGVSFDGFQDTQAWASLRQSLLTFAPWDVVDTLGLIAAPLLFAALYLAFCWAVKRLSGDRADTLTVASAYVMSLVPIAIAYNLAHFISLLLIQGQIIIPLASDPFGFGWDIFGTADYRLNLYIISGKAVWFISLAAIVLGHVASVYLAHLTALRRAPIAPNPLMGQIPMLTLMILYTVSSLWIIAQPLAA